MTTAPHAGALATGLLLASAGVLLLALSGCRTSPRLYGKRTYDHEGPNMFSRADVPPADPSPDVPATDRGLPRPLVQTDTGGNAPADRHSFLIIPEGQAHTAARTHTVRKGDTLSSIARQYFGADWRDGVKRLYEANRTILDRPDDLTPGTRLRIPQP